MLKVSGLSEFDNAVKGWLGAVEKAAEKVATSLALDTLTYILKESPQYSGDFVANWNTTLDAPDYTVIENAVGGRQYFQGRLQPTYQKGSQRAIQHALTSAKTALGTLKLGQHIYLANGAYHRAHIQRYKGDKLSYEGPGGKSYYGWKLEEGLIKLRPVNEGAEHMVRRAATSIPLRYGQVGSVRFNSLKVF